jgi:hypothetical protein
LEHPNIDIGIANSRERTPWDIARADKTKHGDEIRSMLAKKEGTTWIEGELKRVRRGMEKQ